MPYGCNLYVAEVIALPPFKINNVYTHDKKAKKAPFWLLTF